MLSLLRSMGEDKEVPVQKLIWLWIAEGFIRKVEQKALLEDVAMGYLMDLIGRILVMVSKRGSDGRVKFCKIHDMLHKLCLTKVYDKLFPPSTARFDHGVDSFLSLSFKFNSI